MRQQTKRHRKRRRTRSSTRSRRKHSRKFIHNSPTIFTNPNKTYSQKIIINDTHSNSGNIIPGLRNYIYSLGRNINK